MDLLANLALGGATALSWHNLLYCLLGATLGTLVGVLRGQERETRFRRNADGHFDVDVADVLRPGEVSAVSPSIGDVHIVENALSDEVSISIHVYGGNIGRIQRHVFERDTGVEKPFVSGYASKVVPNLWA